MQVRAPRRAVTIYEKMQIVKFAQELDNKHQSPAIAHPKTRVKGKVNKLGVTWNRKRKRGLDIQAQCRIKFGSMLGGMNVSRLRKKAKDQKWFELTEDQQRRMYSLTDSMKKALDLDKSKIKGWRALTEEEVKESLEKEGKVQRWKIPGEVIKENGKEWLLNESMQMT